MDRMLRWLGREGSSLRMTKSKSVALPLGCAPAIKSTEITERNFGWGARIRTWEWRNQNPLPYHLATPQYRRIGAGRLGRLRNIATGPAPSNVRPGRPAILARQAPYNNVES